MPDFIDCPICETTGAKAYRRKMCVGCRDLRKIAHLAALRERQKVARADGKSGADAAAMKGFSKTSQSLLSRKL